jgi:hypothetical protein
MHYGVANLDFFKEKSKEKVIERIFFSFFEKKDFLINNNYFSHREINRIFVS